MEEQKNGETQDRKNSHHYLFPAVLALGYLAILFAGSIWSKEMVFFGYGYHDMPVQIVEENPVGGALTMFVDHQYKSRFVLSTNPNISKIVFRVDTTSSGIRLSIKDFWLPGPFFRVKNVVITVRSVEEQEAFRHNLELARKRYRLWQEKLLPVQEIKYREWIQA